MSSLVQQQVGGVCEGLGAERATEGSLARVHTLVLPQVGGLCEALATHATRVGPLASVHVPVAPQARSVTEGFATLSAGIGPLTRMKSQMVLVVGRPLEGEATLATGEGSQARVHTLVDSQQGGALEGFAALPALVGPLTCVVPQVVAQPGRTLEGLATLCTFVGPLCRNWGRWRRRWSRSGWGYRFLGTGDFCNFSLRWWASSCRLLHVALLVSQQAGQLWEGTITATTAKGLSTGRTMAVLVTGQACHCLEGFPARKASKIRRASSGRWGLQSRVSLGQLGRHILGLGGHSGTWAWLVLQEELLATEALLATIAAVYQLHCSLSSSQKEFGHHRWGLGWWGWRLRWAAGPLMLAKVGTLSKALPTNAAAVRAFSRVHMPVAP